MSSDISPIIKEKAPLILAEIKKAKSILLHCHPSPDPDSVGSALAMKFALEGMGKKATVIKGDSDMPGAFMHFPGASDIVPKNFFEIDPKQFDLFIVLDSSSNGISRLKAFELPASLKIINIDHHNSNPGFGAISCVVPSMSSCCEILYWLFKEMDIDITPAIAADLFIGMYTDTGGFKYAGTTANTFLAASALATLAPDFPVNISKMENSRTLEELIFQSKALASTEPLLGGRVGLATVTAALIKEVDIPADAVSAGMISSVLRSVAAFDVTGVLIETMPGEIKCSFRSKDGNEYDVSKLAVALGGGGHKAAAGAELKMSLSDAKKLVVAKAKELYNL